MKIRVLSLCVLAVICLSSAAFGSASRDRRVPFSEVVLTVGNEKFTEGDLLQILGMQVGGNEMNLGMAIMQMDMKARMGFVRQVTDQVLLYQMAIKKGVHIEPFIANAMRWQTIEMLSQVYLQRLGGKWDMSEEAARKYYGAHKEEFVQLASVRVRHVATKTRNEAREAQMRLMKGESFDVVASDMSVDEGSAKRGGMLGWVERGMMPAALDEIIFSSTLGTFAGPVETGFGWHVVEVLERRPERQLTFEDAYGEAFQRLRMWYVKQAMEELEKGASVTVDEKVLENLGGMSTDKK